MWLAMLHFFSFQVPEFQENLLKIRRNRVVRGSKGRTIFRCLRFSLHIVFLDGKLMPVIIVCQCT